MRKNHDCPHCGQDLRLPADVAGESKELETENDALRAALRWLTNVACGVGKAGGAPEPGEYEAAIDSARALLDGGTDVY